ncbi:MAG: AsmA family protein [Deltaproteobacteria bacterium]|jgi:AsmA protein|nr:AsmA family protein [Deltaproteobacteria bacterium]
MKKSIKIILCAVAGLVLLLAAALTVIVMVVDPNDYKPQIAELVEKNTGFRVQFNGPLELKVLPRLGLGASDVVVLPQAAFGESPLLILDEASLRMALLPLLGGSVEVDSLLVSGVTLNLHTNKQGANNWDMPSGQTAGDSSATGTQPGSAEAVAQQSADGASTQDSGQAPAPSDDSGAASFKAAIASLRVENCTLSYQNDPGGQNIVLNLNELDLQDIAPGRDVALLLDAAYAASSGGDKESAGAGSVADLEAGVRLEGTAMFDPEKQLLRLNLPAISASLNSPQFAAPQAFNGSLSAEAALRELSGKLALALGNADLDLKLEAESQGMPVASDAEAKTAARAGAGALPILGGKLSVKSSPAKLLAALGIKLETADSKALEALNLDAAFSLSENNQPGLLTCEFTGKLDSTDISGDLGAWLPGSVETPPGVDYLGALNLQLGDLVADGYLPPASGNTASGQTAPDKSAAASAGSANPAANAKPKGLLKDTPLEKAMLDLDFKLARLTFKQIPMRDVHVAAYVDRGTIDLRTFTMNVLQGSLNANGRAGLLQAVPPVNVAATVTGLDMEQALKQLASMDKFTGKLNLTANLNFTGLDWPAISKSLSGNGKFNIAQARLRDFQLIPEDAPAALLKYRKPDYAFENISASFTANRGVLDNKDLQLLSPDLNVKGAGKVNLGGNSLDYKTTVFLPGNVSLPLKISGKLDSPSYGPDFEAISKATAKGLVDGLQSGKLSLPSGIDTKKAEEGVKGLLQNIRRR